MAETLLKEDLLEVESLDTGLSDPEQQPELSFALPEIKVADEIDFKRRAAELGILLQKDEQVFFDADNAELVLQATAEGASVSATVSNLSEKNLERLTTEILKQSAPGRELSNLREIYATLAELEYITEVPEDGSLYMQIRRNFDQETVQRAYDHLMEQNGDQLIEVWEALEEKSPGRGEELLSLSVAQKRRSHDFEQSYRETERVSNPGFAHAPQNPGQPRRERQAAEYSEVFWDETKEIQARKFTEQGILVPLGSRENELLDLFREGAPLVVPDTAEILSDRSSQGRSLVQSMRNGYLQVRAVWAGENAGQNQISYEARYHTNTTQIAGKPPSFVVHRRVGREREEFLVKDIPVVREMMRSENLGQHFSTDASGNIWASSEIRDIARAGRARDRRLSDFISATHFEYVPEKAWE